MPSARGLRKGGRGLRRGVARIAERGSQIAEEGPTLTYTRENPKNVYHFCTFFSKEVHFFVCICTLSRTEIGLHI